jgi:glutamate 5-kinase
MVVHQILARKKGESKPLQAQKSSSRSLYKNRITYIMRSVRFPDQKTGISDIHGLSAVKCCQIRKKIDMSRIVVKVGTTTLVYPTFRLNIKRTEKLVEVLSDLKNRGHEIIFVSSGAIAMGVSKLNYSARPSDMPGKQAMAAIGQCELMYTYDRMFRVYNHIVGQVLVSGDELLNETKLKNFRNIMSALLKEGVIPIINENDAMTTFEISSIGDNDTLAGIVAKETDADLLVLLSDIDGLYTADPHLHPDAQILHHVDAVTPEIEALASGSSSGKGTGGMITKLQAARMCMENGIEMAILNGTQPELLYDLVDGKEVGTLFRARKEKA